MKKEQFRKICDDVDAILAEHNRTCYCEIDEDYPQDIHISLNNDFGKNTLPIYTDVFTDLNNYFEVIGNLFISNFSLGDDFRPHLWLCYEGVLK